MGYDDFIKFLTFCLGRVEHLKVYTKEKRDSKL